MKEERGMNYATTVNVRFDPRFMCEHKWVPETFGLGKLLGQHACSKCEKTKFTNPNWGNVPIDRTPSVYWRSSAKCA